MIPAAFRLLQIGVFLPFPWIECWSAAGLTATFNFPLLSEINLGGERYYQSTDYQCTIQTTSALKITPVHSLS